MKKLLVLYLLIVINRAYAVVCSDPVYSNSKRYYMKFCSDGKINFYDANWSERPILLDDQTVELIRQYEKSGELEKISFANKELDSLTLDILDDFKDIEMPEVFEVKPSITTQVFTQGEEGASDPESEYQEQYWR